MNFFIKYTYNLREVYINMLKLNVLEILKKQGKTKYWLFNQLNQFGNMSYTNFNNIISNKTKSIKYENIEKLCKILNCQPNDLFKIEKD